MGRISVRSGAGDEIAFEEADLAEQRNLPQLSRFKMTASRTLRFEQPFPFPACIYAHTGERDELLCRIDAGLVYPTFLFDILLQYAPLVSSERIRYFVETGTLFGHTCVPASFWFEKTYSIELSEDLWSKAQAFSDVNPSLNVLHGNSADVLPTLLPQLDGPTLFFLDAHWSGDQNVDWSASNWSGYPVDTALVAGEGAPSSEKQVPLMQEIEAIFDRFPYPCLIVIDDWASVGGKDVGFKGEDWTHLSARRLMEFFGNSTRTRFHLQFDKKRYLVGLSGLE
jgi:hypothetical protein